MPIDYHERRQVNKNRPKNRPMKLIILFTMGAVVGIYSLGIATGWFLYRAIKANSAGTPVPAAANARQQPGDTLPSPNVIQNARSAKSTDNDPPLTFYYTLPKGEKASLGSGLNPAIGDRQGKVGAAQPDITKLKQTHLKDVQPQKTASAEQRVKPSGQESDGSGSVDSAARKAVSDDDTHPQPGKISETAKRGYTVQVASCTTRKESEEMKTSLDRRGLFAYVVESKIPGKGVRYRVRLGSRLDYETAGKVAAKVGKGAIVVPE